MSTYPEVYLSWLNPPLKWKQLFTAALVSVKRQGVVSSRSTAFLLRRNCTITLDEGNFSGRSLELELQMASP